MNTPLTHTRAGERGFTLVELLITMVLLGIVVALVGRVLTSSLGGADEARVSGELRAQVDAARRMMRVDLARSRGQNAVEEASPSRMRVNVGAATSGGVEECVEWEGTTTGDGWRLVRRAGPCTSVSSLSGTSWVGPLTTAPNGASVFGYRVAQPSATACSIDSAATMSAIATAAARNQVLAVELDLTRVTATRRAAADNDALRATLPLEQRATVAYLQVLGQGCDPFA